MKFTLKLARIKFLVHFILFVLVTSHVCAQTINTVVGTGTYHYSSDGTLATNAGTSPNAALFVDHNNNLYFNDGPTIRMVAPDGILRTFAGSASRGSGFSGDGGQATDAQLGTALYAMTEDSSGNIYIIDNTRIRKVNRSGIITTYAGNGTVGSTYPADGTIATACAMRVFGIDIGPNQDLYFAFQGDYRSRNTVIGRIDHNTGRIYKFAGGGSSIADGVSATSADISGTPLAVIRFDHLGNLYIVCRNGTIARVSTDGTLRNFAGQINNSRVPARDSLPATSTYLNWWGRIVPDKNNDVIYSDPGNNRLRIIRVASDSIFCYAGDARGRAGALGDGGHPLAATFDSPGDVSIDTFGNIFVADRAHYRIRMISNFKDSVIGVDSICMGDTVNFTSLLTGNNWESTSGNMQRVPGTSKFVGLHSGFDTIIHTFTYFNIPFQTRKAVYVKMGIDAGVVTGPTNLCVGMHAQYSSSVAGGTWRHFWSCTSLRGDTVFAIYPGVDTLFYHVSGDCGYGDSKKVINILPSPDTGIITYPAHLCLGANATLSETSRAGHWVCSDSCVTINSRGEITAVSQGIATISYVTTSTCGTMAATARIIIDTPVTPDINIRVTHDTARYIGEIITLDANVTYEGYRPRYQWYLNGSAVLGATSNYWWYTIYYQQSIFCVVTSSLDCITRATDTSNVINLYPFPLAIEGVDEAKREVELFPNPAAETINVKYEGVVEFIQIADVSGRVLNTLISPNCRGKGVKIDVSALTKGVYIARFIGPNVGQVVQFLKD